MRVIFKRGKEGGRKREGGGGREMERDEIFKTNQPFQGWPPLESDSY